MELAGELKERGLVEHVSADIEKILAQARTVYLGIDPTADSMHVGHLVPLLLMRRLADAGHKPILLVGGGTGMIGDPKERGERVLLDMQVIERNKKALAKQMKQVIGRSVRMVDNAEWLLKVGLITFLRDIGKHFTVNDLVKRDLIKKRLDTPDESISYTEFTYSLLQAYDYLMLNKKYACDLQIGATDQWTNILSGVDLIRKKESKEVFALTVPLITDASGKKFGKSEGNAVWLDAKKTSPFQFYQFWMQAEDESVEQYLKVFTFMPLQEISAMVEMHRRNPGRREAQKMLAKLVTQVVHGAEAAARSAAVSEVLYGAKKFADLSYVELEAIKKEVAVTPLAPDIAVADALVQTGLASSKSEGRRLIEAKGISFNDMPIESTDATIDASLCVDRFGLLRRGRQVAVISLTTSK